MEPTFERAALAEGIYFTAIVDPKFKSNRLSVNLFMPLSEETAAGFAILPAILHRGCRDYPDPADFSRRLAALYGASVDWDVKKLGDNQQISLSISAIDDRFTLSGEPLTAEISRILCSMLLDPVLEDGCFPAEAFETEKKGLLDNIRAELNNKVTLAATRCQQVMCAGQPYAVNVLGSIEHAQQLNRHDVFEAYNTLLRRAHIELMFTGCGNASIAREIVSAAFAGCDRQRPEQIKTVLKAPDKNIRTCTEQYAITQAKLSLGFTCGTAMGDAGEAAVNFMTAVLGGTPFSKLFLNVREKLSLCYYCSASYDHYKGIILINSGIEAQNRQCAEQEILSQLKALQDGALSREEFDNTVRLFDNLLTGVSDALGATERFYLSRLVAGKQSTPAGELAEIRALSPDTVIEAARRMQLSTVYFMQPKEAQK